MLSKSPAGPGFRDWALLAFAVGLVLAGILILPTKRNVGIVNIALFGVAACVFAINIHLRLRDRRAHEICDVAVVGGVPIRESRTRALILGGVLAGLGTIIVVFGGGGDMGFVMPLLGGVIAAAGLWFLLGIATKRVASGSIIFMPDGLRFGERTWSYRVPWDDIVAVGATRLSDNPVLLLHLRDPNAISVTPPAAASAVRRRFAKNQLWVGAPIALMTFRYAIDLHVLAQAIERYFHNPAIRAELARRSLV